MVISIIRLFCLCLGFIFAISCNVDLLGLIAAGDIDERLKSADTFHFVKERDITTEENYSFLVLTDTHISGKNAFGLEKLKNHFIQSDKFIVVTGDITQSGNREEVERFMQIAKDWKAAGLFVYPVIGNHDIYFNNWHVWRDLIGSTRYRVNSENTTLLILDSANDFFSGAQLNWLEHELASAKEYVFVFTHTNIFTDNNLPLLDLQQQTDTRERSRLVAMLSGRAAIVFSGHVHNRISTVIRNTNYQSIEDFISYKTFARVYVANNNSTIVFFNLNKL